MLIFRPPLRLILFPLAEIAALILVVLPIGLWKLSRHFSAVLRRLSEIDSEPSLTERFAMLEQFRQDSPNDALSPLWGVFEQKVRIPEEDRA